MSTTESDSDSNYHSDGSEFNFIPGYVEIEDPEQETSTDKAQDDDGSVLGLAYANKHLADQEWLNAYQKAENEWLAVKEKLCKRFSDAVKISEW